MIVLVVAVDKGCEGGDVGIIGLKDGAETLFPVIGILAIADHEERDRWSGDSVGNMIHLLAMIEDGQKNLG